MGSRYTGQSSQMTHWGHANCTVLNQKQLRSIDSYGSSETCLGFLPALVTSFGHASLAVSWQETEIVSKERFICARMVENIVWTHLPGEKGTPTGCKQKIPEDHRSESAKASIAGCWFGGEQDYWGSSQNPNQ